MVLPGARVPGEFASEGVLPPLERLQLRPSPAPRLEEVDRGRNGRNSETRYGEGIRNARARQRAFVIAVSPGEPDLAELRELLRTAGVAVAGEMTQRRDRPEPDRYMGKGKLAELKRAIAESDANLVAVDDELLPRQERNLEQALDVPVIDRTAVILDIFADHANSAEGKLQVELAQLEYNLARMRGLWTHLERLGAGIGTRGPGESQIETDRRLARDRIAALRRRLRHTKATRSTMRAERERAGLPSVALAGYTNAGKSTLLNALTGAEVGVGERLFHTLDPTTRSFEINGRSYLLTDTVGFIRKLPHQLVEAFSATLEETLGADLIVHVADASVPEDELHEMLAAVDGVLSETGAGDRPRLLCLNKIDLLDEERRRELSFRFPGAVQVSGDTGEGLDALREAIEGRFLATLQPMELLLPFRRAGCSPSFTTWRASSSGRTPPTGVVVRAPRARHRVPRFERFAVNGRPGVTLRFRRISPEAIPPVRAHETMPASTCTPWSP